VLLEDRNAVVYGGAGSIGSAVGRAFAREGATVHLAGRTPESLQAVADGASDWAAGMTATKLIITAGSYVDAA
jgi:NAD(P)-dependent dehydrogenase (short-subunit alcohol dehydrogenase family)